MSRLNDLLRQLEAKEPALAKELRTEYDALADRRAFGLNFERHTPETVELPGRQVRRGDKVHVLPERGQNPTQENSRLWRVTAVDRISGVAMIEDPSTDLIESQEHPVTELVVVAEFRDPIYPGLVSTGRIERGGDKPFHTVINAENYYALQTLLFTHRGQVDCIYIDPPYNTGNEGWVYNDKYVAGDDHYKHSKWLAFMERRLILARELLSPDGTVCVSIGSAEVHRLKLLMDEVFPRLVVQMITVQTTAGGKSTSGINTLNDYLLCATPTDFIPSATSFTGGVSRTPWEGLVLATFDRTQRANQAYPIFVDSSTGGIHSVGPSITAQLRDGSYAGSPADFNFDCEAPQGTVAIWPITAKGEERVWRLAPDRLMADWTKGYIKVSPNRRKGDRNAFSIQYLPAGVIKKVESGEIATLGTEAPAPTLVLGQNETAGAAIPSVWTETSHRTSAGNDHLKGVLGGKRFPYPKPLGFTMDVIQGFGSASKTATILDFFGGSGTTLEAVMRLNAEDGGSRRTILVTNNEVAEAQAAALRSKGLRRGDPAFEACGVHEFVTKPRIETVAGGLRPDGSTYSEGLEQNVEFFDLTYEAPLRVSSNREFARVAPLLWLRAGSQGRRIDDISAGFDVADTYGVLADLDQTEPFLKVIAEREADGAQIRMVFMVTDDDRLFTSVCRELPEHVEAIRLYEAYLRNFEIEAGRSTR